MCPSSICDGQEHGCNKGVFSIVTEGRQQEVRQQPHASQGRDNAVGC